MKKRIAAILLLGCMVMGSIGTQAQVSAAEVAETVTETETETEQTSEETPVDTAAAESTETVENTETAEGKYGDCGKHRVCGVCESGSCRHNRERDRSDHRGDYTSDRFDGS